MSHAVVLRFNFWVRSSKTLYTLRVTVMIWNRLSMNIFIFQNSFSPHSFQTQIISRSRFILTWIKKLQSLIIRGAEMSQFRKVTLVQIEILFEIMSKWKSGCCEDMRPLPFNVIRKFSLKTQVTFSHVTFSHAACSKRFAWFELSFSSKWWQNEKYFLRRHSTASKPSKIC